MILYLDTSTPTCHLWLDDRPFKYPTDRNLARDLLGLIQKSIKEVAYSEQSLQKANLGSVSERGVHAPIPSPSAAPAPHEDGRARVASPESSFLQALRSVTAIAVFKGPGSFTGLRIGATIANTLADQLNIPIVGTTGSNWRHLAQTRLEKSENDKIVLPLYGKSANITTPRK